MGVDPESSGSPRRHSESTRVDSPNIPDHLRTPGGAFSLRLDAPKRTSVESKK